MLTGVGMCGWGVGVGWGGGGVWGGVCGCGGEQDSTAAG